MEKLFYDEVREKARVARGAHSHPNRSGCRLHSYTDKEVKKMAGSVFTVNTADPELVSYATFKFWSEATQKEWIQAMLAKYNIGPKMLAEAMGTNAKTFSRVTRDLGFDFRGHKPDKAAQERFRAKFYLADTIKPKPESFAVEKSSVQLTGICTEESASLFAQELRKFAGKRVKIAFEVEVVAE